MSIPGRKFRILRKAINKALGLSAIQLHFLCSANLILVYESAIAMSRYYRDLHDRELLTLAEQILTEVSRRKLAEVLLPCQSDQESNAHGESGRSLLNSVIQEEGRLFLLPEGNLRHPKDKRTKTATA